MRSGFAHDAWCFGKNERGFSILPDGERAVFAAVFFYDTADSFPQGL